MEHKIFFRHCDAWNNSLFRPLPIWLDTEATRDFSRGKNLFKFEVMRVGESDCQKIVEEVWKPCFNENIIENIQKRVAKCGRQLDVWNKVKFDNLQCILQ